MEKEIISLSKKKEMVKKKRLLEAQKLAKEELLLAKQLMVSKRAAVQEERVGKRVSQTFGKHPTCSLSKIFMFFGNWML